MDAVIEATDFRVLSDPENRRSMGQNTEGAAYPEGALDGYTIKVGPQELKSEILRSPNLAPQWNSLGL